LRKKNRRATLMARLEQMLYGDNLPCCDTMRCCLMGQLPRTRPCPSGFGGCNPWSQRNAVHARRKLSCTNNGARGGSYEGRREGWGSLLFKAQGKPTQAFGVALHEHGNVVTLLLSSEGNQPIDILWPCNLILLDLDGRDRRRSIPPLPQCRPRQSASP
jgi:hypothetical protein